MDQFYLLKKKLFLSMTINKQHEGLSKLIEILDNKNFDFDIETRKLVLKLVSQNVDIDSTFIDLFHDLFENAVPTVEMTQQQKDLLLHFKETTWFSLFLAKFNDPEFGESLPDLSCFDGWGVSKERENDLLTAWLHPESIKVVD